MPDEQLLSLIRSYELASLGSQVAAGATISTTVYPSNQVMTTLEIDRYNALNAYFGRPLGNEVENRSQIVLPELRDTIEWIMPQLMRMFVGAKQVVRFDAENPQDEAQADLETAVVNHVFMVENNGFYVLHDFFKDALLMRNGYAEVYAKDEKQVSEERYKGLTEEEVALVLQDNADETIEVIGQREYMRDVQLPIPQGPMGAPFQGSVYTKVKVYDLHIRRTGSKSKICVTCLPPEEMRVSPRAREGMEEVPFAMHLTQRARSDLITDGYDPGVVEGLAAGRPNWLEIDALARNQTVDQLSIEDPSDRAMQEIELRKVIMRVDYDGDGTAELRRILVAGDKILENEVIEETPFASCVPKRMPHRHTGLSLYDEIMDLQVIKTTLFRAGLDNLTIANNQRVAVDWRHANFDDLLSSRPGGVVRGDGPPSSWIMPIETPSNIVSQVIPTLEYIDKLRGNRTGIGEHLMGLDPDELQNVTKGAQLAAMSTASLKIEMLARLLAEGVKEIFRKIHASLIRFQDKPLELEISGKWVQTDPSSWRRRTKVSVNVGLGSGNRDELRTNVQMLGAAQMQLAQMGLVGPKQAYETFKVLSEALGFQNPERFAMDPQSQEYQQHMQQMQQAAAHQPQAPQVQAAQIRAQMEQQKQQSEDQREIMSLQERLLDSKRQAFNEAMKAREQMMHEHLQNENDRANQAVTDRNNEVLSLAKILAPIIGQQLKGDESANAGEVLAEDTKTAESGLHEQLSPILDQLTQHITNLGKPRVATLSDGRQIRIE